MLAVRATAPRALARSARCLASTAAPSLARSAFAGSARTQSPRLALCVQLPPLACCAVPHTSTDSPRARTAPPSSAPSMPRLSLSVRHSVPSPPLSAPPCTSCRLERFETIWSWLELTAVSHLRARRRDRQGPVHGRVHHRGHAQAVAQAEGRLRRGGRGGCHHRDGQGAPRARPLSHPARARRPMPRPADPPPSTRSLAPRSTSPSTRPGQEPSPSSSPTRRTRSRSARTCSSSRPAAPSLKVRPPLALLLLVSRALADGSSPPLAAKE